jgi:ankyrin repeat protein
MDNTNELLKKYYKSYNEGIKKYNMDKDKAFDCFKESLDILQDLRKNHTNKIKKHEKILEESESECHKYINLTLESTIESESIRTKNINNKDLLKELEKGDLNLIKTAKYGEIDFSENSFSNETLLHIAILHGDTSFLKYAFILGARIDTTNKIGNTLLEYACLQQDPNMINFLGKYGANMQKHLYFRSGNEKYINNNNPIDICILLKHVLSYIPNSNSDKKINNKIYNKIKLLQNVIKLDDKINFSNFTYKELLIGLMYLLNKLPDDNALTYLNIITEELNFVMTNKLGCPHNKVELILVNLVPFIDYQYNLSIDWVIILELKYLIINLIKKKKKYNSFDIKNELMNTIWETYIKTELIQEDYLGCLISQWITKIKV